ncbi:Protein YTP1 like protein [Verticillium longisporum]|uniref:Protein YTP1 like protein n=1 Tax=Verticillium longisporum TaxID=100787 RepID=A0A8I2ZTV2_VERLO|nr:Protein YTP1 like protein [Verticillium longisporum]
MALGHDHGVSHIAEGESVSPEPIDSTLWVHIFIMMLAFGIIFPIGMVLGITKNRWHVPTQVLGTVIAVVGYFIGHAHGGREFVHNNVHAKFANLLMFILAGQVTLGVYLRLHLEKGIHGRIRRIARPFHGVLGKAMPVISWVQILFGGITALGFCQGDHLGQCAAHFIMGSAFIAYGILLTLLLLVGHLGQCAAHFIMGSAFIAYGILLTLLLLVGQMWLRRTGRSQEFFDSVVIAAWGCVNTFTEHHWGTAWVKNDWQHTTMGIVWWCAGLAGVWLSKDRDGNPKRNFIPGFVIFITGWAMSAHPQELHVSEATHSMFGKTLMAVGITRIIEIAFVVKDEHGLLEDGRTYNSWQLIPAFLLFASGFLFMGATEEQMLLVDQSSMDHVAYILILFSFAFLLFLFVNMLISLYERTSSAEGKVVLPNGKTHAAESRQLRDAEEFELEGLMSDDDEEDARKRARWGDEERGMSSPSTIGSTVGGNSDRVAR